MTSHNHPAGESVTPGQRYLDATHAARDQYLATTSVAYRIYLSGPFPDRETYQQVENTAWKVYYAASRTAWNQYTAEVLTPGPLPARTPAPTPTRDAAGEVRTPDPNLNSRPLFTPYPISDESYLSITDPPDKPRDPRNPEGRI